MREQAGHPDPEKYVRVGRIAKGHGIKGEVKVIPYSGQPSDFGHFPKLQLVLVQGRTRAMEVLGSRGQGKFAILRLAGIEDRQAADLLNGAEVWTEQKFLPPLAEDEFYWHEMVGLKVETDAGLALGEVTALFSTGAHDVLVITGQGREYLIPAKKEFMVSIEREAKLLVVSPPPGLLEMND